MSRADIVGNPKELLFSTEDSVRQQEIIHIRDFCMVIIDLKSYNKARSQMP